MYHIYLERLDLNLSLNWLLLVLAFVYYGVELIATKTKARKYKQHPVIGNACALAPRDLLNLLFASKATCLLTQGYQKVSLYLYQP